MQCLRCGFHNDSGVRWCLHCGAALSPSPAGQQMQPGAGGHAMETDADGYPRLVVDANPPQEPSWLGSALRARDPAPPPPPSEPVGLPPWLIAATQDPGARGPMPAYPGQAALPPAYPGQAPLPPAAPRPAPSGPADPMGLVPLAPPAAMAPQRGLGSPADELTPGAVLKGGRYRILQPYHVGPHGQPLAQEPPLLIALDGDMGGQRVLLQEIQAQQVRPEDAEQMRRLITRRLQDLSQVPGMPRLLDSFSDRRRHFLVFELPSGETLLDRLQRTRSPLDEAVAIRYVAEVLEILAAIETQRPPVVHGNICPANIILRPSGSAVLIGFSPTLLLHPNGTVEHGAAGGMPGYAAPEQTRGQATSRSDLYAVCAVLQHAVTGVAPAPRANALFPPARRQNPNVSLELEEVLARGLRPSATQRFGSAAELRDAILPLASGRRTIVPEDLRDSDQDDPLRPVRDAKGRLVLPRQRATHNPLVLLALVLLLLVAIGGGALYAASPHGSSSGAGPAPTPNQILIDYQTKGVGLSGGELIFDKQRPDFDQKQSGARALAAGDIAGALASYRQAVHSDPADAEAAIYAENLAVLTSKAPYISLVAGVAFGTDDNAARAELQGIYLAQHRCNQYSLLPNGVQVRVLIGNSGTDSDGPNEIAGYLASLLQGGNPQHVVGIVGWPEADQTKVIVEALKPFGFPVLSPVVTSDSIGGYGVNLFRMVPSDRQQGTELADVALDDLAQQQMVVISDSQDPTSSSIATAFLAEVQAQQAVRGVVATSESYTSGGSQDFTSLVRKVSAGDDTLIVLACGAHCDQDTLRLAQAVQRATWYRTPPRILVDSHAFSPSLLGIGTDPVATAVRADPAVLNSVYFTFLTDRDVWKHVSGLDPSVQIPTFADDYSSEFGPGADPDGLTGPDQAAILAYDASTMLVTVGGQTIRVDHGQVNEIDPSQVRLRLLQYDIKHPYIGVSGAIAFTITGGQEQRALVIERFQGDPGASSSANKPVGYVVDYLVHGGKTLFCFNTDCAPS